MPIFYTIAGICTWVWFMIGGASYKYQHDTKPRLEEFRYEQFASTQSVWVMPGEKETQ